MALVSFCFCGFCLGGVGLPLDGEVAGELDCGVCGEDMCGDVCFSDGDMMCFHVII